jgi:osmotically inducible protein OsmC
MAIRHAQAVWTGTLREGSGTMKVGSGYFEGPYTFASRFEESKGTNPEELIGAAHAGCFSMYLSALLTNAGFTPTRISTSATVHLGTKDGGPTITNIELDTEGQVPGLTEAAFLEHAEAAKLGCPVSKALTGVEIKLNAHLAA